jgi:hypothetical protein
MRLDQVLDDGQIHGRSVAEDRGRFGTCGGVVAAPTTRGAIHALAAGKITEHWSVADFLGMLQQIGVA